MVCCVNIPPINKKNGLQTLGRQQKSFKKSTAIKQPTTLSCLSQGLDHNNAWRRNGKKCHLLLLLFCGKRPADNQIMENNKILIYCFVYMIFTRFCFAVSEVVYFFCFLPTVFIDTESAVHLTSSHGELSQNTLCTVSL